MKVMPTSWKRGGQYRWRLAATVAAALTFLLLTFSIWWSPVDVGSDVAPRPAGRTDLETVRRLLLHSVDDGRGTWPCSNSSGCTLTPSLLATTLAARQSVYSRTGLDCLAMFHGHSAEIEAARKRLNAAQIESTMSDVDLGGLASNCAAFKRTRGYFTQPLSREEAEFPIAYSILAYDNIPQVIASTSRNE